MTKFIEFKSANESGIAEIVANKGICWQVKDDAGELFLVQKKHVVRGPWEEDETEDEVPAPAPLFSQALAQVQNAKPAAPKAKREKEPAADRTDAVTLKELCFQLNVIPRIARRRLRKAQGNVGTGSRWEWKKDSPELAAVTKVLSAPTAQEEADAEEDMGDSSE